MLHAKAIFPSTCIARGFFLSEQKRPFPELYRKRSECLLLILLYVYRP